jgi:hypothetical protein
LIKAGSGVFEAPAADGGGAPDAGWGGVKVAALIACRLKR